MSTLRVKTDVNLAQSHVALLEQTDYDAESVFGEVCIHSRRLPDPEKTFNDIREYDQRRCFLAHFFSTSMSSLQKALDSIQALSPDKRASLRALLDTKEPSESDFTERLVALGVLERRGRRSTGISFDPDPTNGTPASKIIIEDRR